MVNLVPKDMLFYSSLEFTISM